MDIKLFSLCKQEVPQTETGKKHILKCVRNFFPECEEFTPFTSQKRMLLAAAQSLRAADIVIIAVQNNMYNATKKLLAQALGLKILKSTAVFNSLKPLCESGKISQQTLNSNSAFPQGSVIMPTEDMFNCGFALSSGSQHIIYLPVEAPRADEVVFGSLYDFFASICESDVAKTGLNARHRAIIKRTADKLDEDSVKITFAASDVTDTIESITSGISSAHCFSFKAERPYYDDVLENLVTIARDLKSEQFSTFTAVFSDISINSETGEKSLKVAIADESGTNKFTFFALENESDEDFILNCIDKTMMILYNYEKLSAIDTSSDITTKADKTLRKNLLYITAGAIGASTLIGLILSAFI